MPSCAFTRRRALLLSFATATLGGLPTARAQTARTTRLLVPVPPGGGMDSCARLFGEQMRDALGTVVVENRPGAALRLAIDAARRAEPDGATLLFAPASPFTIYPHIYKKLAYDVRTDFIAVTPFCHFDFALGVPGTSPINTLAEYVDAVRRAPDKNGFFAVPAAGAAPHFVGAQFARVAGLKLEHIPYKGSAPAMQDLIGGAVPAAFNLTGEYVPYLPTRRVKVLATTGARRSPFMPEVPTFTELGYKDMELGEWFGVFAPAKTPPSVIEQINAATAAALRKPEVTTRLSALGYSPLHLSSGELGARVLQELAAWGPIVKSTGFSLEE